MMRSRYFPGGPTPDGLDSDIMFKNLGEAETGEMRERARRDSEEMITDNRWVMMMLIVMIMLMTRYRMTPPESPRDREGPSAELAGAQERERGDSQNQGHVRDL